ncbi:MAG TPA: hypothetical protein ENK78_08360 [Thiothrix sp.]|nr:hypothetical protein [Thiothrix sp.]
MGDIPLDYLAQAMSSVKHFHSLGGFIATILLVPFDFPSATLRERSYSPRWLSVAEAQTEYSPRWLSVAEAQAQTYLIGVNIGPA